MRLRSALAGALLGAILVASSRMAARDGADRGPAAAAVVSPPETSVLLLPPIDATVDAAKLGPLRRQIIRLAAQYQFIARHFTVLGDGLAAKAAAAGPALDLRSLDRAMVLQELAGRAHARWVVSIAVLEMTSDDSSEAGFRARSTVLVQIWDAVARRWLIDETRRGWASRGGPPGWLFIESLRDAVGSSLAEVLKPYPTVVTVSRKGSIVDYLSGQTAPFLAEPGHPFAGLKALADGTP